jgi:hypothetical protein
MNQKEETVFVAELNLHKIMNLFFLCSRSNAFIILKEPPTKLRRLNPPIKWKQFKVENNLSSGSNNPSCAAVVTADRYNSILS